MANAAFAELNHRSSFAIGTLVSRNCSCALTGTRRFAGALSAQDPDLISVLPPARRRFEMRSRALTMNELHTGEEPRSSSLLFPGEGKPADSSDPLFLQVRGDLADKGFFTTSAEELITWARTGSLMWMTFGL